MEKPIILECQVTYNYGDGRIETEQYESDREKLLQELNDIKKKGFSFFRTIHHLDGSVTGDKMKIKAISLLDSVELKTKVKP